MIRAETKQADVTRSVSLESFLVLPLEIRGIKTIEAAIEAFESEERIEGQISKKNSFRTLPHSLIIGLKRFYFDPYQGYSVKLHDIVQYPDILKLNRQFDKAVVEYRLQAVVEHIGKSPDDGHYVCWVRRFDGMWLKFDDDRVTSFGGEAHLDIQAYLLLYNRIIGNSSQ
jgi:uncharacterized UBP type Zn finger protein